MFININTTTAAAAVTTTTTTTCEQAQLYCNPDTAKKISVSLLLVSLAAQAVKNIVWFHADVKSSIVVVHIYLSLLNIVLPLTLLVINMTVVCQVCQKTHNAAVNVGQQQSLQRHHQHQHQQPTSFSPTMPTMLLVSTSLIYVLLCGTWFILYYVYWCIQYAAVSSASRIGLQRVYLIAEEAHSFIFSCAFLVYLVRGKKFRSDLRKLFCQCAAAAEHHDDTLVMSRRGQSHTGV